MDTRGRRDATTLPHPILDEWITLLYAEGKSRRTVKERAILIRRLEKDLAAPALAATTGQIAEWLASDHLTKATRSGYHSMLKGFYSHLVDYGYRDDNPMLKIRAARRPRRQPRPITRTQWVRLYEQGDDEMKAMVLLGAMVGFRVHEIAKFDGRQIDPEARTVEIEGKGGALYILPASDLLLEHAKRMPYGIWFPSQRGRHIGGRTVSQRIRLHMIKCRVPGQPHCLRHFFGTELVEGGADLRVAQELLRHLSLATTAIYVQASDRRKREAIDRLDPFANAA